MTNKISVSSSNPSTEQMESILSAGGHYYRTFLKPALIEGLSVLGASNSFLLSEIYYSEVCYADDDLSLSEQLLCSIPEARSLKHQALDALSLKINDQTGILLSRKRLSRLLKVTRAEEKANRKLGTNIKQATDFAAISGAVSKLIQLVVTINYLTIRTTRLFGDNLYHINYIGSSQSEPGLRSHVSSNPDKDKKLPEGITLKTIDSPYGRIELIVDGLKNFYLLRAKASTPAPTMQIAWPNHQRLVSGWIHSDRKEHPSKSWMPIGFLDERGLFVLRLAGEEIRFENVDEPLSISCTAQ